MVCQCARGVFVALLLTTVSQAGVRDSLKTGTPDLQSVGPLAFGPAGILFISDPKSAAVFAVDTEDTTGNPAQATYNVPQIDMQVAALLGTKKEQAGIIDVAVNPKSGNVYLSVMRGSGPDAKPVVLRVNPSGKIGEFSLKNVRFAKATLPNPAADKVKQTRRGPKNDRLESITDLSYVDGRLIVAGLSNEEFASNLRAISFPFSDVDKGTSVETFHGNHGRSETHAPVRTFVPITIGDSPQLIAAYTCTPLVRIPLADLRPGKKVTGTTVAELGNWNRPLDIIAYKKGGKQFLLMANNKRGVMKISTAGIETREAITTKVDEETAGQPYETIKNLKGVTQLDRLNDTSAVVLVDNNFGASDLRSVPLP